MERFLFFFITMQVVFGGSTREESLINTWASQNTRNSGWNMSDSYCTWDGFTCNSEGNLTSIAYTCQAGSTFYGNYPPLDVWSQAAYDPVDPAFHFTRSITFMDCILGPNFPDQKLWLQPPLRFSSISSNPSTACPISLAMSRSISCSPSTVIRVEASSSTQIDFLVNKQTGWIDTQCRYTFTSGTTEIVNATNILLRASTVDTIVSCPAPSSIVPPNDSFTVDILVNSIVLTQTAFSSGFGCPPGQGNVSGTCTDCLPGTYNPTTQQDCQPIPQGGFSSATGATSFTLCPVGTSTATTGGLTFLDCTVVCQAGQYQTSNGCTPCPSGTYSDMGMQSTCKLCTPGWISSPGSTSCTICPAGSAPDATGAQCVNCTGATYAPVNGSAQCAPCREGYESDANHLACVACNAGSYRQADMDSCQPCPAGLVSFTSGRAFCRICPLNTFSTGGASSCTPCPPGTMTYFRASSECVSPQVVYTSSSFAAGIALTAIGGSLIILIVLVSIYVFGYHFPKQRRELNGISDQMIELAKA